MTVPDDATPDPGHRHLNPILKLAAGTVVGVAAIWLVISIAGGVGDAVDAVTRMRPGFVALAVLAATVRIALYGVQIFSLARRTGPLTASTATGLALVVFGFGAVTPASPAEGLTIASRELQHRGRSKRRAHLTLGFSEWFAQRTFYALAALDLIVVIALGHLTLATSWPLVIVAAVVLAPLGTTALLARRETSAERVAIIVRALRIGKPKPAEATTHTAADAWHSDAMAMIGPPRRRVRIAAVSAAAVLADAATLVYRAAGTLLPAIAGAISIPVLRSHRTLPRTVPATAAT